MMVGNRFLIVAISIASFVLGAVACSDPAFAHAQWQNECASPWGAMVEGGSSVTAYSATSVACGVNCSTVAETRSCGGGVLSGSYTNQSCTPAVCDTTPDVFTFTDQTGVAVSSLITSNSIIISGINTATSVSVSGGGSPQIRVAAGAWSTSGTITNGQSLQVRLTSSASGNTALSATVTVGGVSDNWSVTTVASTTCNLPWGGSIASGASVLAYQYDLTSCGYCSVYSQNRTCSNGTLSGSFTYDYCNESDCGACFGAGTKVLLADGGMKAIEDLAIGDRVIGRGGKVNTVVALKPTKLGDRKLYTINGKLKVTADHPALTDKGWGVISRDLYAERYHGRTVDVTLAGGAKAQWETSLMEPSEMVEYGLGDKIAFGDEGFKEITSLTFEELESDTPLYTVALDGDGTMQLDGGFVFIGLSGKMVQGQPVTQ